MLKSTVIALMLVSCVAGAGQSKPTMEERSKPLSAAAKTPFFSEKAANNVKKVVAGAENHKADDQAVAAPAKAPGTPPAAPAAAPQPTVPSTTPPEPGTPAPPATPAQPAPAAPEPPTFAWRLVGVTLAKGKGVAVFESAGQSLTVREGGILDDSIRVVDVNRNGVVLDFHGKRLSLMPW